MERNRWRVDPEWKTHLHAVHSDLCMTDGEHESMKLEIYRRHAVNEIVSLRIRNPTQNQMRVGRIDTMS